MGMENSDKYKVMCIDTAVGGDVLVVSSYPPHKILFSGDRSARADLERRRELFRENLYKSLRVIPIFLTEIFRKRDRAVESFKERMTVSLHRGDITYLEYGRLRMKPLSFMDMVERDIKRNKRQVRGK